MPEADMKQLKQHIATALGIIISIVAVVLVVTKIDVRQAWQLLKEVPLYLVILLTLAYLLSFPLRGLRWKLMLLRYRLPFRGFLNGVVLGFAGNNILPARGGELIRARHFDRVARSGYLTAFFSVLAEKILDGCALLFLLGCSVYFMRANGAFEQQWVTDLSLTALPLFALTLLTLIAIKAFGIRLIKELRKRKGKLWEWLATLLLKVARAIYFLRPNISLLLIVLLSLAIWLLEGSMFILAIHYFLPLTEDAVWLGLFTLVVVNFGLLVPSSPGYVGIFQGMTLLALGMVSAPEAQALAVSLLVHFFQFVPVTLWGIALGWQERHYLFGKLPKHKP